METKEINLAKEQAQAELKSIIEMVNDLEKWDDPRLNGECEEEKEKAREAIEQSPLSVLVREGFHEVGQPGELEEFEILLCTGGPAVRIIGRLGRSEPSSARIEYQDWGTPWTRLTGLSMEEDANLLIYCRQFYYGD